MLGQTSRDLGAEAGRRGLTFAPAQYTVEDSYAAFLTNELIKYLSVRVDKPWFVHLSYLAPHPPFVAPEPYHAMYDPADVPKPVRAATAEEESQQHPYLDHFIHNQRGWGIRYDHDSKNNLKLDDRDVLQARATYYGMMSEVDFHIGRLLAFLDETDAYDNTLVLFTTDHGEQLGDHWQFAKYAYFDQSFHIPLIVRDPRAAAQHARGRHVNAFTESVDVMPTILDCLQVPIPSQCDGEPLAPFCRGETPADWRAEAHWEFDFRRFVDTNGDSVIDKSEREATGKARKDRRGERRRRILERFDTNNDGYLDEQERAAARESRHAKILKHFDANGDGVLDTLEKKTARKVRRHRNRGHRQDRQPRAVPGSEA